MIVSCSGRQGKKGEIKDKRTLEPIEIAVERPVREVIELIIDTTGTLYAIEESNVAFEVDGKIVEILKDLGDFVKRGDALARIYPEEYALRKAQSEADFKNAEMELKRVQELYEKKFATQQQLDMAQRNLNVAKAQYDLALKKLSDCTLRAPISGYVAKRNVNPGEYVRTGSTGFYIVNSALLKLKAEVSEGFSGYLKVGDRVEVETDSGHKAEGQIMRISPYVNPESRAFAVEVKIDNRDNLLKPGSFAKAKIFASYRFPALTISEGAVTFFSGVPRVFRIVDQRAIEQVISIKERRGRRFVVESGISEEDTIASTLVEVLTNNQPVRVKK